MKYCENIASCKWQCLKKTPDNIIDYDSSGITKVLLTVTVWCILSPFSGPLNLSHHLFKIEALFFVTFLHLVLDCTFLTPETPPLLVHQPGGALLSRASPSWVHLRLAPLLQLPQLECGHGNVEGMESSKPKQSSTHENY